MIIIVGGGLSGLALGQFFLQHNIPFHIHERDERSSGRSQGYRIRISEDGANALRSLIPNHLFDLFEQTSSAVVSGGYQMNASTTEASLGGMASPPGKSYNIDRATVRSILMTGLESHISFSKHFSHYTSHADGVEAHFTDSTSTQGSLLIGADGTRSPIRRQLLPQYEVLDTQGRAICGKTALSALSDLPSPILTSGIGVISSPSQANIKLFCDPMRFHPFPESPFKLPHDYLYWVLLFQSTTPLPNTSQDSLLSLSSQECACLATSMTSTFHPSLQPIMTSQDTAAAAPLRFMMARPPIQDHTTNPHVTLVGDAAHPMPPVGGVGANMAWTDAAALAKAILSVVTTPNPATGGCDANLSVDEALAAYEQDSRDRGNAWLGMAAGRIGGLLGTPPMEQMETVVW
jgi:2-polyprenyl-6-methoxyphenol hydroxylase-like FAD-dependent oxidoreductase